MQSTTDVVDIEYSNDDIAEKRMAYDVNMAAHRKAYDYQRSHRRINHSVKSDLRKIDYSNAFLNTSCIAYYSEYNSSKCDYWQYHDRNGSECNIL